jgi:hypothetical protein
MSRTDPLGTDPLGTNPLGTDPLGTNPLGTNPLWTAVHAALDRRVDPFDDPQVQEELLRAPDEAPAVAQMAGLLGESPRNPNHWPAAAGLGPAGHLAPGLRSATHRRRSPWRVPAAAALLVAVVPAAVALGVLPWGSRSPGDSAAHGLADPQPPTGAVLSFRLERVVEDAARRAELRIDRSGATHRITVLGDLAPRGLPRIESRHPAPTLP